MLYHSTRDKKLTAKASEAILRGIAPDGGLYVPEEIPKLDKSFTQLAKLDYPHLAYEVMKLFIDDFTPAELKAAVNSAYNTKNFDHEDITCLVEAGDAYYLELFHGRTIAFKDMALSILPYLMKTSAKKNGVHDEIVILTATSGDTGKAALAGFDSVEGTSIVVFYPKDGVSPVQERQMVTQAGANTHVIGIRGNFDDAQREVKRAFTDAELNKKMKQAGYVFSSANSINIGRLVPQIAYYVYAYTRLMPREINFVVPTGNFGNILAAYYAYRMGVPIHKLICASNENKVLYDFFESGDYDRNREFHLTTSPSMDILISSNLERLIYRIAGNDPERNSALMADLSSKGIYSITDEERKGLKDFYGGFSDEKETAEEIARVYKACGYVMDTHTAVASSVYHKYEEKTGDKAVTVIASTASPFKFTRSVMNAIDEKYDKYDDFTLIDELSKLANVKIPQAIEDIRTAPVVHDHVCEISEMPDVVRGFLK